MSTSTVPVMGVVRGHEADRDQAARLEHQEVAGRIGLDRADPAELGAGGVPHRGADQLVDPQGAGGVDGLCLEVHAPEAIGGVAVRPPLRNAR